MALASLWSETADRNVFVVYVCIYSFRWTAHTFHRLQHSHDIKYRNQMRAQKIIDDSGLSHFLVMVKAILFGEATYPVHSGELNALQILNRQPHL